MLSLSGCNGANLRLQLDLLCKNRVVLQTALIKALTQQRSSRTQSSSERMPLNPRVRGGSLSAVTDCCEG